MDAHEVYILIPTYTRLILFWLAYRTQPLIAGTGQALEGLFCTRRRSLLSSKPGPHDPFRTALKVWTPQPLLRLRGWRKSRNRIQAELHRLREAITKPPSAFVLKDLDRRWPTSAQRSSFPIHAEGGGRNVAGPWTYVMEKLKKNHVIGPHWEVMFKELLQERTSSPGSPSWNPNRRKHYQRPCAGASLSPFASASHSLSGHHSTVLVRDTPQKAPQLISDLKHVSDNRPTHEGIQGLTSSTTAEAFGYFKL